MKTVSTRAFVDAIESGRARILAGEDNFILPAALLPAGTREGSWLELRVRGVAEPPEAKATRAARKNLAQEDQGKDIKL